MIRNYLKVAFRNIIRNKAYSLINVLGLTIGVTFSCLVYLYVDHENSYDRLHPEAERLYRIVETNKASGETRHFGQTAPPVAATLKDDYPEVEEIVRMYRPWGHIDIEWNGERISERNWIIADPTFFEVFGFELKYGDERTALIERNSIVLSSEAAEKYFPGMDPVGELIKFNALEEMKVTGVLKEDHASTHIEVNLLLSRNTFFNNWDNIMQDWGRYGAYSYVRLAENADLASLAMKFPQFSEKYWSDEPSRGEFYLQPVTDIYFGSENVEFGIETVKGQKYYVTLFTIIGVFILLIASINYMNLATAQSMKRAREIGMRKASGARRWQLVVQFLSESLVLSSIAFLLSAGILDLLLPTFNVLSGMSFDLNLNTLMDFFPVLLGMAFTIGIVSGSYPSFYLSRMNPADSLKGEVKAGRKNILLRQGLVITQFTLSIVMIASTIIVYRQMEYIQNSQLGFDKEQMLVVDINNGNVRSNFETMKTEFLSIPSVSKVAASSRVPGEWKTINEVYVKTQDMRSDSLRSFFMCFDEDVLDTYGMEMIAGSNFSGNKITDSLTVILNESAVKALDLKDPIGTIITLSHRNEQVKVIGVLRDFNYQSLHNNVAPLVVGYWANPIRPIDYFSLKIGKDGIQETLEQVTLVHERFDESTPIEYHFLDQQIDKFYEADLRAGKLFGVGAGLTIFIACLGLFGLASFMVEKKTKEIGIRKVMGASTASIFMLLSRSFSRQILIAFVIAAPIAWKVMGDWLSTFQYRISLQVWIFLAAGFTALLIAILTISYRAIRASLLNPSETLKTE